jgi:hypothetical protein
VRGINDLTLCSLTYRFPFLSFVWDSDGNKILEVHINYFSINLFLALKIKWVGGLVNVGEFIKIESEVWLTRRVDLSS